MISKKNLNALLTTVCMMRMEHEFHDLMVTAAINHVPIDLKGMEENIEARTRLHLKFMGMIDVVSAVGDADDVRAIFGAWEGAK